MTKEKTEPRLLLGVGSCSCRGPTGGETGPLAVLIMINDLSVADTTLWKYVDDTTLVESVSKNETSYMQLRVDELVRQSEADGFQLNESKCKELTISFSRSGSSVDHITINDKQIEVVSSAKLLGVVVSDNLRWNAHVESICKKAATSLYFLKQLKRAKVPPKYTAVSKKVVGKSARDNPERYYGWFCLPCSPKKFERMAREATDISS